MAPELPVAFVRREEGGGGQGVGEFRLGPYLSRGATTDLLSTFPCCGVQACFFYSRASRTHIRILLSLHTPGRCWMAYMRVRSVKRASIPHTAAVPARAYKSLCVNFILGESPEKSLTVWPLPDMK